MTRFASEALARHDRSAFASGNGRIDAHFQQTVSQDVKRNYAACYVLLEKATGRIAGFYTLSAHTVPLTEMTSEAARKLPRYPNIPAVLIGWLGRGLSFRGQHIGDLLLYDAFARLAASPVAAHALYADAIDADAAAFYRDRQFEPFLSRPHSFYLPMKTALTLAGRKKAWGWPPTITVSGQRQLS